MSDQTKTAQDALLTMLKEDGKIVLYRPRLSRMVGTTSAILLQQMYYRYNGKPFYKLKAPCSSRLYTVGDSWCEELGFLSGEFDTALRRISTKCTKGKNKTELLAKCPDIPQPISTETKKQYMKRLAEVLKYLIIFWTDSDHVTWYSLNRDLFAKLLIAIYIDKLDCAIHGLNGESQFIFIIDSKKTNKEKDSVAQKQSDAVAADKCQECDSTLADDGRCCNCEMVQGKCEKCGDTGISIWEDSGLCVTCEDAVAADNGDVLHTNCVLFDTCKDMVALGHCVDCNFTVRHSGQCCFCDTQLLQRQDKGGYYCPVCIADKQDGGPTIELGSDGRLTEESWDKIESMNPTDAAWLEQHAVDADGWTKETWMQHDGVLYCTVSTCNGIIAYEGTFYRKNKLDEILCPGCWLKRDDTPPALTAEQAAVLEYLDKHSHSTFASIEKHTDVINLDSVLDIFNVLGYVITGWHSAGITDTGRAALEAWQLSDNIEQVETARWELASKEGRIRERTADDGCDGCGGKVKAGSDAKCVDCGRFNSGLVIVDEPVDKPTPGECSEPERCDSQQVEAGEPYVTITADKDIAPETMEALGGMVTAAAKAIEAGTLGKKPKVTKAKKKRKARKPKRTPEELQRDNNMWEAVKYVWRVDDNASWKIARLQQFFLGTIKKTGRYKAFFDTQLNEQPADGFEVVAFGHWYRSEYDNIPLPENGDKLRSHFETFRGSGERWQTFMRKANKTILAHIPKYTSPDIELEREQLQPVVGGEQEIISEEQQQEVKQIMQDLADKFGGRK